MAALDWPPVWTLFHVVMAYLVSVLFSWDSPFLMILGAHVVLVAVLFAVWAAFTMRRARTTVIPRRDPSALVTGGPFAFTRNPIYVADLVAVVGFALIFGQPFAAILAVPLFLVLDRRFAGPEEARLAELFGEAFDDYRAKVRRWV